VNPLDATQTLPLTAWLDVLSAAMPPRGTLVVGAGAGSSPWVQWLRRRAMGPVWLVEGDESQYQHLLRQLPAEGHWTPRRDVVSGSVEATCFHRASNPAESGLLAPQQLGGLWPNLTAEATELIDTPVTLDALASDVGQDISWLVLDCLPAGELLQGAMQLLPQLDLMLVRVVTSEDAGVPLSATHVEVDRRLHESGLRCIRVEAERHPGLAAALYVHDVVWHDARLTQALRESERVASELRTAQGGWIQDKEAAARRLDERDHRIQQLTQSLEAAYHQLNELAAQHQEALSQARAEDEKRTAAWQAEKDAWRKEREGLVQARDQAAKQSEARLAQIQALEKRIKDLLARQADMPPCGGSVQEELAKAAAQVDLLKDILLPPGLRP
jgi:hypothetical protein